MPTLLFVREQCAAWDLPLHVLRVADAEKPEASVQAWARRVRYGFFERVAAARGMDWVAVAHHASDQAETVLLQALRGAGVLGLAGMPLVRPLAPASAVTLARPLLDVPRADLQRYAAAHGLAYHDDASNENLRYRRARVRHVLLPQMRAVVPDIEQHLAATARTRRSHLAVWQARREAWHRASFGMRSVDLDALQAMPHPWRGRVLLDALEAFLPAAPRSRAVARRLGALVEAQVGRHVDFATGRVVRDRAALRFEPVLLDARPTHGVLWPGQVARARREASSAASPPLPAPGDLRVSPDVCLVEADAIAWPLTVRPWQAGDAMQPFGMDGHKKVSDLLTDAHWPATQRRDALVVCAGETLVWVPGVRAAEATRLRPGALAVVRLTFAPPVS